MTAAINPFAAAVVNERRIPFEIRAPRSTREETMKNLEVMRTQALLKDPNGLSLYEIDEEIDKVRSQRE